MENSAPQSKWYDKTWLVAVLCIIFFPVGLYALWKNSTISQGWKIGVTIVIALAVFSQFRNTQKVDSTSANTSSPSEQTEQKTEAPKGVGVGEVLHTDYFDITVNKVGVDKQVSTGNQFTDLKPEEGVVYLIMNVSYKTTDQESRDPLGAGSIWINYNGKDYEFDKAETIMLEGWIINGQINPLTTKTVNLAYKIPAEIKGDAYWQPGRAGSDKRILLGSF